MVELPTITTEQAVLGAGIIAGVGAVAATAAIVHHNRKNRKRKKNRNKNSRKKTRRSRLKKHGKKRYTPHTAGKRKDKSHRRIRYTSKGQPYVIGSHGKAKFISKKSAKASYNRKGGKY